MFSEEWISFIEDVSKKLQNVRENDHKTEVLARVAKLAEEVGELASAAMISVGSVSKKKIDNFNPENLAEEFGDVIICACLLADQLGVDMNKALADRLVEINNRWKNN